MKFKKKVLANGLTVLFEKRDVPVTTVMFATKYGSAYESEEEKGMAHFIEHLCFKGTEKRTAKEIAYSLEKVGGLLNAFTHEETTAYHVKLPSEHLKLAVEVLSDVFFNPVFPAEEVERERNVICEEIRMYNDDPRRHTLEKIKNNLYEKPFGDFIGGSEENIKKFSRDDLLKKHRGVYVPRNAILCVVGNNDFEEVLDLAEEFCVEREFVECDVPEIKMKNGSFVEERGGLQQANLALGFHFSKANEKERYASEIFSVILGQGMSSKLFEEVREKRGLVYGVKSDLDLGGNYGYMIIWAGTEKKKVEEVKKICLEEFEKMKTLTKEELEEAKKQVIGNHRISSEGSDETAVNLILEEISSKAENFYDYEKNIEKVSLEEIRKIAEKKEFSFFALVPK